LGLSILKVLITGGAGFIGSHLACRFNNADVYDNLIPYYSTKLKLFNKKLIIENGNRFFEKDIAHLDPKNFDYEYIFHLAAQPGVRYSVLHPYEVVQINLNATVKLLETIRKSNTDIKRFVFVSSSSVFGTIEYLPIDEKHPKNPISPYGASKLGAEKMVKNYYLHYGIPIVIVRPFTVVGVRQRPDMALHKFIESMIEGTTINVYGDGTQTRDWTHVDNIVNGILQASKIKSAIGEDFNLGTNNKISVNEILKMIHRYVNNDYKIKYLAKNIADPDNTQADTSKAKKILGYEPTKTLEDAIKEHLKFYINHKYLYK